MKKLLTILLLLPSCLQAQITIQSSDLPQNGDSFFYSNVADLTSVDPTMTGTNYTWDYSSLIYSFQDTLEMVDVTATPLAYQLYFNNILLYPDHKADYAVVGVDFDAFGQITISERYDYFRNESSALKLTGFGANINGIPTSVKYDTIDQIYPLPMTYGTTDSTTAYYIMNIPTLGSYGQWIRRKVEVDGWGELTTPYQTYSQCLRVKTTLDQRDTLYIDQIGFGNNFDRPTETIYEWYADGISAPVMKVIERGGIVNEVKYQDEIHVGVEELSGSKINIYPVPASNFITISMRDFDYNIYSVNGKLMKSGSSKGTINIEELPVGIYFIKAQSDEFSTQKTFVKQ